MTPLSVDLQKRIYILRPILEGTGLLARSCEMEKRVHVKLDRNSDFTLREVLKKIEEIQAEHPELDVFFDGDDYAICSRPRKAPEKL
jgi:hypothetical protein